MMNYRRMFLNPKFGAAGLFAFPYFFIVELLGPIFELISYVMIGTGLALGYIQWDLFLLFVLVDLGYGMLMSMGAVLIEESAYHKYPRLLDLAVLMVFALLENLGFRQINSLFRLKGLYDYIRGDRTWGKMDRIGFNVATPLE